MGSYQSPLLGLGGSRSRSREFKGKVKICENISLSQYKAGLRHHTKELDLGAVVYESRALQCHVWDFHE